MIVISGGIINREFNVKVDATVNTVTWVSTSNLPLFSRLEEVSLLLGLFISRVEEETRRKAEAIKNTQIALLQHSGIIIDSDTLAQIENMENKINKLTYMGT
jgi:predicted MPP superfamily phosphohydrolase